MENISKKPKYLCLYSNCNKKYVTRDGVKKHANKHHKNWIKTKTPTEYSFKIPEEYEGDDYVRDFMKMVENVLDDNETKEDYLPPPTIQPLTLQPIVFSENPFMLTPIPFSPSRKLSLSTSISEIFKDLFCKETL